MPVFMPAINETRKYKNYETMKRMHWTPDEYIIDNDANNIADIPKWILKFIIRCLLYTVVGDDDIIEKTEQSLFGGKYYTITDGERLYLEQKQKNEAVHSDSYAQLLMMYTKRTKESIKLDAVNNAIVKAKLDFSTKWLGKYKHDYTMSRVVLAIMEEIFFSSLFLGADYISFIVSLMSLHMHILRSFIDVNYAIRRDETYHGQVFIDDAMEAGGIDYEALKLMLEEAVSLEVALFKDIEPKHDDIVAFYELIKHNPMCPSFDDIKLDINLIKDFVNSRANTILERFNVDSSYRYDVSRLPDWVLRKHAPKYAQFYENKAMIYNKLDDHVDTIKYDVPVDDSDLYGGY